MKSSFHWMCILLIFGRSRYCTTNWNTGASHLFTAVMFWSICNY